MTIYYTMIGSRETPDNIMRVMEKFAEKGCHFNYVGRSGGADGADTCLEVGVHNYLAEDHSRKSEDYIEIYLPWKDFNHRNSYCDGFYTLPWMGNCKEAEEIASSIHPKWKLEVQIDKGLVDEPKNWKPMKQGAKKLHTRNVYQLLGKDLRAPSRFVICWAKPKYKDRRTEEVLGGTGTAVKLGIDNGVEIINLYHPDQLKRVKDWIDG